MDIAVLRELLEKELSNDELTPLDEEFYREIDGLVKALKIRAESSKERGEEIEERLYLAELSIAEQIIREILKIRLHKIVDMAFEGVPKNLVGEERKIFAILSAFINREPLPVEHEVVEEKTGEVEVEEGKATTWEAYIIKVDVPKVLDEELREYGPFKAGDLVTLPRSIARVLMERDAAERILVNP
ncbi:DNA replication complex subunit Gins51 [Pyrococcus yayanosii]|uniref:Gins51 C-terminal domain-containing protein n=1 Tax=Pyrococcus yayanosii (strain CH1 / JCM 16557) TaxID=529709 RepID=F8AEM2_PYRYC|nr:hypothetical protein [Pyrococcus yayanosii]AEH24702.1 hypothetical protein PYCH_10190 [Pyrococcus yayanosii CH1]